MINALGIRIMPGSFRLISVPCMVKRSYFRKKFISVAVSDGDEFPRYYILKFNHLSDKDIKANELKLCVTSNFFTLELNALNVLLFGVVDFYLEIRFG